MNASISNNAVVTSGGAFVEYNFNDTRCKALKRYKNIRVIGSGAQGLVL